MLDLLHHRKYIFYNPWADTIFYNPWADISKGTTVTSGIGDIITPLCMRILPQWFLLPTLCFQSITSSNL